MDDPWGSPWASNDAPSENDPPLPSSRMNTPSSQINTSSSRTTNSFFLSPPPKAFFGGSGTSLPATQSPWPGSSRDNDDGFNNIWTTAADRGVDGVADGQNEWGGAWGGESGYVQPPPRLSPRLSTSGKESPLALAWPENAAASPVFLGGHSRSRTPSLFRHASPDPWATELSLTNRSDLDLSNPSPVKAATSNAPTIETGRVEQASHASHIVAANDREHRDEEEDAMEGARTDKGDSDPRTGLGLVHEDTNTGFHEDTNTRKQGPAVCEPPSRSSSTCTLDSHDGPDGPDRQDSPITSIDEDRGTRIQNNNMRKTSGKVQELVGIYDDLARAVSEEPASLDRHEASQTRAVNHEKSRDRRGFEDNEDNEDNDDNDGAGFGDFENAFANADGATESPGSASFSSEFSSTPRAETKDIFTREPQHEREEDSTTMTETPYVRPQKAPNRFRHVVFDTNLTENLNKLFPDLSSGSLPKDFLPSDSTEGEVSDHIVTDSFATISERKSWYRISRFGSMRKHNSGDDENYHRVTWQASQLHDDTVKIVRRWMEEDSYAGKAILGGTKRMGFFDWDSDAAPVKLDEVFRRKKSAVTKHMRTTSIPAGNTTVIQNNTSAAERPYRNSTGISLPMELLPGSQPTTPVVPGFGWNSEAPATRPVHNNSPTTNLAPAPTSTPRETAPISREAPKETASRRLEPIQVTSTDEEEEEEEEDDWGEMVSSPRVAETIVEPNISAFLPTEKNNEPTPRPSLAISNNVDKLTELKSPPPEGTRLPPSDPWLFSDFSVLDKPRQSLHLPRGHASQAVEGAIVPESKSSLHNRNSLDTSRSKAPLADIPLKGTAVHSDLPRNESQDDIIVQRILQSLPDLSYMLR
ncbi:hypothetical protein F4679DRAFT_406831 [Xylaria curta]|nr:hypothetical protein F4679DRAFT_406831 [Xylaria curta]